MKTKPIYTITKSSLIDLRTIFLSEKLTESYMEYVERNPAGQNIVVEQELHGAGRSAGWQTKVAGYF
ncbi:MAG TPA: hypothetical protein VFW77_02710 [Candidatus Saccharimonadales bacterium]|nr:hypothetical protein [Candidatus Saccharimonadales bacterium]